ncbi:ribonuclease P protein subunit p38-like [Watersipora subatra]|uniref:ribonuclease P protein subunit p38-like n=1 Tax=Watersipora subatra TaxID=2589382 RepID=UPI00355B4C0A
MEIVKSEANGSEDVPPCEKLAKMVKCQTLATQELKKTGSAKKKSGKKKYLKAPFQYEWPTVSAEVCKQIVTLLQETFKSLGLQRDLCKRGGKIVAERKGACSSHVPASDSCSNWSKLVFGVNAVTRSMEKEEVSLLLCDSNVYPSHLTSHLIEHSVHKKVPAAAIASLSDIGDTVGLRSVTCMAFKSLNLIEDDKLTSLVSSITKMLPKLLSPIEPLDSHPKLQPEGSSAPELSDKRIVENAGKELKEDTTQPNTQPCLLPDTIDYASLYVFKADLDFDKQEDFISLSTSLKRRSDIASSSQEIKKLRYMSAEIGKVKYDPNREKKDKT